MARNCTCGIYAIKTPAGSSYVGSSICMERRFNEHKSLLSRGKHHSSRLQKAYTKYGDKLTFVMVEECDKCQLIDRERYYIKNMSAKLNVCTEVNNVWASDETRKKFEELYKTEEFKIKRSAIASNISTRWRPVECSNGKVFKNLTDAGKAYGLTAAAVAQKIKSGYSGRKHMVRFKYTVDDWVDDIPISERRAEYVKRNGPPNITKETRLKMSISAKRRGPPLAALMVSAEANKLKVIGTNIKTGQIVKYNSVTEAATRHHKSSVSTAGSQISKCLHGVKKTAYGFFWREAKNG